MGLDSTQGMMSQYNSYYQCTLWIIFSLQFLDQASYYDSFVDPNTPFSTKFPRAKDYNDHQVLTEVFSHLENINDPNFDVESISPNAQFYIMRSGNDDNIHKVSFIKFIPISFNIFLGHKISCLEYHSHGKECFETSLA